MPTSPSVKPAEQPQLEPHEVEMKRKLELLQRVRVLREKQILNRGMINNMQPGKKYVWVNENENRQIHFKGMGYELCTDPKVESPWKRSDNSHKRGDLILYQIDADLDEAIQLEGNLRGLEGVDAAKAGFELAAHREGVPTYEPGKRS